MFQVKMDISNCLYVPSMTPHFKGHNVI